MPALPPARRLSAPARALADRLVAEYAGAVPPGQVLALVARTAFRLGRDRTLDEVTRGPLCESQVRHALAERLAESPSQSLETAQAA